MDLIQYLLIILAISLTIMLLLWLVSIAKKDASIVDPYWGFGFVILSWIAALWVSHLNPRSIFLLVLVSVWGVRLSAYLLWRNHNKGEDRRYRAMREKHGASVSGGSACSPYFFYRVPSCGSSRCHCWWGFISHRRPAPWELSTFADSSFGSQVCFLKRLVTYQMAIFKSNPNSQGKVMDTRSLAIHPSSQLLW